MKDILTKAMDNKQEWEDFLSEHSEANFLQSWCWGEFHLSLGKKIHRTGLYEGEKLVGVMLSIIENARRGRYMTVPAGPIIDWENKNHVSAFVKEIKKIAIAEQCVFIRVRPQLESNDFSKKIFIQHRFVDAPSHLHAELTSQLDITKTEEELLAGMRKATRYEVRKAISLGVHVTATEDSKAIKQFYDLQLQTAKRQKFVPFSYRFLFEQFSIFSSANKALLYSAEYEGKLLAQAFVIFYGQEAAYHYGASTDEGRKYPGAYLIQWAAIKEAKKRGMKQYNFWGVAPEGEKDHRFSGLSLFKRGFGGVDIEYLHAHDLVIDNFKYFLNAVVEKMRRHIRHV